MTAEILFVRGKYNIYIIVLDIVIYRLRYIDLKYDLFMK